MWDLARDFLLWLLPAVVLGLVVGWLWRGRRLGERSDRRRRESKSDVEHRYNDGLRVVLAERDQWVIRSRELVTELETLRAVQEEAARALATQGEQLAVRLGEIQQLQQRITELEAMIDAYQTVTDGETDHDLRSRLQQAVLELVSLRASAADDRRGLEEQVEELRRQVQERRDSVDREMAELRESLREANRIDDLQLIEGLGRRAAIALRGHGFRTFAQVASAEPDVLRQALETAGVSFSPALPTWPEQATRLARGETNLCEPLVPRAPGGFSCGSSGESSSTDKQRR